MISQIFSQNHVYFALESQKITPKKSQKPKQNFSYLKGIASRHTSVVVAAHQCAAAQRLGTTDLKIRVNPSL